MVKVNTNSNTIKVNAASAGRASNLSIGTPQSYYDGLAKEWAISDNLVQGIDYSSKYYANIAKSNADSSKANLDSVRDAAEEVIAAKDNALNDISDAKINTLESLIDEGNNQIELIKEQGSSYATKEDAKYTAGNGIDITDNIISNTQTSAEWGNITGNIENQEDLVNYVKKYSGGLEVCDIGMALYVDETKGLRRYLNGQIVEINSNTQAFLNRLLQIQTTNPEYFTTEDNWQAEALLNIDGCVYKFVLNYASDGETVVSVRLPKYPDYVEINAGGTLPVVGNGISLGFTNGIQTGVMSQYADGGAKSYGAFLYTGGSGSNVGTAPAGGAFDVNRAVGLTTAPTKSGIEATLNQTKLKLRYYIQIATGQETEVNITNEIELNNPFFFGMSNYFKFKPNNLSWLKSAGYDEPKAAHPDYYNWILENVNKGVKGFKGQEGYCFIATDSSGYYWWVSTESPVVGASVYRYDAGVNSMFFDGTVETLTSNGFTFTSIFESSSYTVTRDSSKDTSILHPAAWITDNDFEINTSDETFRLPLKNGTEGMFGGGAVVGNGMSLGLTNGSQTAGLTSLTYHSGVTDRGTLIGVTTGYGLNIGQSVAGSAGFNGIVTAGITTDPEKSGLVVANAGVVPDGWALYYYVGETVQNANLIDAGRIVENYATKQYATGAGFPSDYVEDISGQIQVGTGILPVNNIAPADGFIFFYVDVVPASVELFLNVYTSDTTDTGKNKLIFSWIAQNNYVKNKTVGLVPISKGQKYALVASASSYGNVIWCQFVYAKGAIS